MQQQQAQLDQRALHLQKLMEQAPEPLRKELRDMVELSWIYHESALEGVVYAPEELAVALRGGTPDDPIMASAFDEIRQNKATIEIIRQWAAQKNTKVDADVVKDIYVLLAPDEVDGKKPPAYRKDIPLHRLYFHEIAAPDKIAPKLKAFGQWINAPDTRRTTHVLRLAAKAHFHLLHIYPYPKHSGKVRALGDEPPAAGGGLSAGRHPLHGEAALLRRAQDERERARADREGGADSLHREQHPFPRGTAAAAGAAADEEDQAHLAPSQ